MKFLFSIGLFFSLTVKASLISVSYVGDNYSQAAQVRDIFIEKYELPESLITIEQTQNCVAGDLLMSGIHLCIKESSQLVLINSNNIELTKKSILSFTENLGDNYVN